MPPRQPTLPPLWLISDARNDGALAAALARLPRGSGFIYRHYHLAGPARRGRFLELQAIARRRSHLVVLAGSAAQARHWGADGAYGAPCALARGPALLRLCSAHDLREIGASRRANAILLSPIFATASHPRTHALGVLRFRALAARAQVPVIALGGMTCRAARRLKSANWAAIDGLIPAGVRTATCEAQEQGLAERQNRIDSGAIAPDPVIVGVAPCSVLGTTPQRRRLS